MLLLRPSVGRNSDHPRKPFMNSFLKAILAGVLIAPITPQLLAQPTARPNLLFIMTDQHRWDALGLAGNTALTTPNLDRLGQAGAHFLNFYSTRPICVPARTSILTGRSSHNTGIYGNGDLGNPPTLTANGTSFDQILHQQGYYTRYFGKYHSPTNLLWDGNRPTYDNPDIGNHDHNVLLTQKDPGQTYTESSVFKNFLDGVDPLGLNTNYVPRSTVENPANNLFLDTGYQSLYEALPLDSHLTPGSEQEYGRIPVPCEYSKAAFVVKGAIQALNAAAVTNKPFSITCSIGPPHPPFVAHSPWFEQYPATNMPVSATIADPYVNQPYTGADVAYTNPATIGQMVQCYYALAADSDYWIGKLLDRLEELGLATNTLVIFVSDHGEMLGDHGKNSKSYILEGAAHVPCLIRFPGVIPAGTVVSKPAAQIDLFPTILDYLGVSPGSYQYDGYSLRPLINNSAGPGDHPDYCVAEERLYTTGTRANNKPMYAVRTDRWKLFVAEDATSTAKDALYDMSTDPNEMNNLIGSAAGQLQYRDVAESMKARLINYLTRLNSPELTNIQARVVVPASPKTEGMLDWSTNNTAVTNTELALVTVASQGNTVAATIGGRTCRAKANPATDADFYFDASASFFYRTPGAKVAVECDFYTATSPTSLQLTYDSVNGSVNHPLQILSTNAGQWRTARWYLDDPLFGDRQTAGTDFRIRIPTGVAGYISRVKLVLTQSPDWPPFTVNGQTIEWPSTSDALGWRLYESDTLSPAGNWSLVSSGITSTNGSMQYLAPRGGQTRFFRMQK